MQVPSPYQHVYRIAGLFLFGFLAFLIVRRGLVPPDFGTYGFYRSGALVDARARPIKYGGQVLCVDCHSEADEVRKGNGHEKVTCEACHGPLATHASGDDTDKPRALNPRLLCLQCHTQLLGKPREFPQVIPADHGGDGPCTECHTPHRPRAEGGPF